AAGDGGGDNPRPKAGSKPRRQDGREAGFWRRQGGADETGGRQAGVGRACCEAEAEAQAEAGRGNAIAAMSDAPAPAPRPAGGRQPGAPLPLTVLTGFLGAGKTSLLNRLLKDPALADTAVVINEFGEIGLDHLLVEQADDGLIVLTTGCLCCTMRGDLVDALERLLRALDNGRATFRRVIV